MPEIMAIGPGGSGPEQILSLYIMGLFATKRLSTDVEPTREAIEGELTKDLDKMFEGYEAFKAELAKDVTEGVKTGDVFDGRPVA